ncbi:MAG TPA: PAS domain S-box protein [Vicinamibacterales bacterium]|nr:PAS domain S-box protein [Vicinamibacterales bacterium]
MSAEKDVSSWMGVSPPVKKLRPITAADVRAFAMALASAAIAIAATRLSWPMLARTPFIMLFSAVFITSKWGSESAGLATLTLAALASPYIAPPEARPAFQDSSLLLFIAGAFIGNRIVASQSRMEKRLAESEAQVRASWDSAAVGTALVNIHGQVERLNPAMERLLDYPSAAWAGTSFGYFTHAEDVATEREFFERLMAGDVDDYQLEQRFRRRDGALIWGRVTMSAVKSPEGRPKYALMMIEDITSRRQAEDALRASEEKLRGLFESVPVGLFQSAPNGEILAANPALVTMLGYESPDALKRLNIAELFADPGIRSAAREALATHRPELPNTQTLLERRDGRFITAVIGARAVRDAAGIVRSYEGIVLDLSDRQALEAQLYHAQKQEALGRLVSGVVHDFSNLLTAIGGSTELALMEAGTPQQRGDLEEVLKASQRATVLTRQLMSFSRREKLEPQVLDLNGIITDAGSLLKRLIGADVEIAFALADSLPPIKGHVGQIEQILVNLAINARDAMPEGGRITFATENVGAGSRSYVRLIVKDTGIGMDDKTRARLFEPFFTTKEEGKGTGLGLATVNSIVNRSNGRIEVISAPGAGTTFNIDFPAVA